VAVRKPLVNDSGTLRELPAGDTVDFNLGATINGATAKTTPVDADELGLADSAASFVAKKLSWANVKAGIWSALGALIAAGTQKVTLANNDRFAIADSAASNASKYVSWANLRSSLLAAFGNDIGGLTIKSPYTTDQFAIADTESGNATKYTTFNYIRQAVLEMANPNLLLNPAFTVNQDGLSTTGTSGVYIVDGWMLSTSGASFTTALALITDGSVASKGRNHLRFSCSVAKAVLAAGDFVGVRSAVEGFDAARLKWGTAYARPICVRIRASANVAMVASLSFRNSAGNRSYVTTLNLDTSAQDFYVQVPGDTSGTWLTDSGVGLYFNVTFAAGTTWQTATLDTWQAGNLIAANTQTNGLASTSNTMTLAEPQLHDGSVPAPPFAARPHDLELARCMRYYEKSYDYGTAVGTATQNGCIRYTDPINGSFIWLRYSTPKRTAPTVTIYSPGTGASGNYRDFSSAADFVAAAASIGETGCIVNLNAHGAADESVGFHWVASARI
jgi:hypothetical protein